jgi:hypothetical protein
MRLLLSFAWIALSGCDERSAVEPQRTANASGAAEPARGRESAPPRREGGMYSRQAVTVWDEVAGSPDTFTSASPDGLSRLSARRIEPPGDDEDQRVVVDVSGAIGARRLTLVPGVGVETLWSPRSDALAISTSGAGRNGPYRLILLRRVNGRLEERDVTDLVTRRFGQPVRCDWPEPPNVGAIAWLPNGNVVAAAEIVNHSVCDSYGSFKAYEIDPGRMRIVGEFGQSEAKRRFRSHLGWEIEDADDLCEPHPEQCTVAVRATRDRASE